MEWGGRRKGRIGKDSVISYMTDLSQKLPCKLTGKSNKEGQAKMGAAERPGGCYAQPCNKRGRTDNSAALSA